MMVTMCLTPAWVLGMAATLFAVAATDVEQDFEGVLAGILVHCWGFPLEITTHIFRLNFQSSVHLQNIPPP